MLIAVLLTCICLVSPQQEGERSVPLEVAVPRRASAEAQLEYARGLRRRLSERKPEEGPFWRALAVEAYQAVRALHPDDRERGAEAAFRAGEILRAGGADTQALAEFEVARRLGRGGSFELRALLEEGHVHRRAGRSRKALDRYLEVVASRTATQRQRDDAGLWTARIWQAEGRVDDALRTWRAIAQGEGDALDRVEAYDWWALALVDLEDLEGAAGVLADCKRRLVDWSLQETRFGERVRSAIERMRAVARLADAIASRVRDAKHDSSSAKRLSRKA